MLWTSVQASPFIAPVPPVDSWYSAYTKWLPTSSHAASLSQDGLPTNSADFHAWLSEFLDTDGARYVRSVIFFDASRTSIKSSKILAFFRDLPNSQQQVDLLSFQ